MRALGTFMLESQLTTRRKSILTTSRRLLSAQNHCFLVMEFMGGERLNRILDKVGCISESAATYVSLSDTSLTQ